MKLTVIALFALGLCAATATADPAPFQSDQDRVNYAIGVQMARSFRSQGLELNLDMVVRGLKDALSGEKLLLSEKELNRTMMSLQNELRQKQAAARRAAALEHQKQPAK